MSSVSQRFTALAFLSLVASCVSPGPPSINTPVARRSVPETAATNIHRYVAKHRGWSRSVYHIERDPDERGYAVFTVVHRRDQTGPPSVGRGKSFALYCDPRSYRVLKEMWFQ